MKVFGWFEGRAAPAAMAAAALVFLLSVSPAWAQGGEIQGKVFTDQGQPLPRIPVVVKGTVLRAMTEEDGGFSISGVPPGQQTVVVAIKGFKTETMRVSVAPDRPATADFVLVADLMGSEEIVVTAQEPDTKIRSSS